VPIALLIAAFLFGFAFFGFGYGSGSTGTGSVQAPRVKSHHANCKARMSAGKSRRDCGGGPPANP
jgi:hypothetical protein